MLSNKVGYVNAEKFFRHVTQITNFEYKKYENPK